MKICFTGSRPQKLWGFDLNDARYSKLKSVLKDKIVEIMKNSKENKFHFITGGALGVDTIAAKSVLELKEELKESGYELILELAIPFENQPNAWFNVNDRKRYKIIKDSADIVTYVDRLKDYRFDKVQIGYYHTAKLNIRNNYMVDNSDLVISAWDTVSNGGTKNCVEYAKRKKKTVITIDTRLI